MLRGPHNLESGGTLSADRCPRCESSGHDLGRCPFPDGAEVGDLAEKRRQFRAGLLPKLRNNGPLWPDDLPAFCGPTVEAHEPPPGRKVAKGNRRQSFVAALVRHRLHASYSAANGNRTAASWHRSQAAIFARALGWAPRPCVMSAPGSPTDQVRSWVVMAETISNESHFTADDYQYS